MAILSGNLSAQRALRVETSLQGSGELKIMFL